MRYEYIWLSPNPTGMKHLRSKVRYLELKGNELPPDWSFDGSSTGQASGGDSDLILVPRTIVEDPLNKHSRLALCEVFNRNGIQHETNTRYLLSELMTFGTHSAQQPVIGFEQEYVLTGKNGKPLGWPDSGINEYGTYVEYYPKPQGDYYCGVGHQNVSGRSIVEEHAEACLKANLMFYGTNAEVLLGQWEFQIGPRSAKDFQNADPLTMSDHLWLARYLLIKIAEKYKVTVDFSCKPIKGDWNGSGCHTNFSTHDMRDPATGSQAITDAIEKLKNNHKEHIDVYGFGLEERLTGLHETCSINEFRAGASDRGASIRIPAQVEIEKCGYIEDRRPGANCDPYEVAHRLLLTILG